MPPKFSEKYLKLMKVKNQQLEREFIDAISDAHLNIDASVAHYLKVDQGIFFTHQHTHLGSYSALINLIPMFKEKGVKYFLLEQPQEYQKLFDDPELLRKQINPSLNSEQSAYWHIYGNFIATLKANNIKIIAVAPGFSKDGFGEIITTREEQLVKNIKAKIIALNDKSAKFVGLFGHWHAAMATQLNVKVIAFKNTVTNNSEWQIRPWLMSAADLVPGGYTLIEVRAQFPQEFNDFINLLPKFITTSYSVPTEIDPKHQVKRSSPKHYSLSHCCLFAGVTVAGVVATGVALYSRFSKTPGI